MTPSVRAADSRPAQYMFSALQTTHQHADAKAGILAAVEAGLAGTAGSWSRGAVLACEHGGPAGVFAGTLLALFVFGLIGGAVSLAAVLRPRLLRGRAANRYSFVQLESGPDILPAEVGPADEAADRKELSHTVRFLAHVAVLKYRWLTGAVVCTAVMGVSAGLSVVLQPVLG
ncbi:Pycsar system effector family protein [Streptomyces sp. 142MFCol3.1]|uniref:Pycsar system effector family protein n=1 Tax=Streptomyces sp. 142MFCol3.1 TaxID=1172179 RepID=UPI0003F87230|nr:Pycsar system effector family protein [Streptomyces sp. 142MFCol3.1]